MDRAVLLANGWRRHSIISSNDEVYETLLAMLPASQQKIATSNSAIAIIATYDCAIVNPNLDAEPWLQVLLAYKTEPNKQFFSGRDPRRIHFQVDSNGITEYFETNAACIAQLERAPIVRFENNNVSQLPEASKFDLMNWLSERFKLTTWPDNFNKAIKPAGKRLKAFWKRYNSYLSSLYINLNKYEEVESGEYIISIIVALENGKQRQLLKKVREQNKQLAKCTIDQAKVNVENEIANIFNGLIAINEDPTAHSNLAIRVIEEKSITLHQLRKFYRFSPYSLSEFGEEAALPVDMLQKRF